MKILMISVRADPGGGPEHLFQLSKGLGPEYHLHVACPDEEPYADRYRNLPNVERLVPIPHRALKPSALLKLFHYIKRNDIELIHSHGKGAGLYGRLLSMMSGCPSVHTFHGLHIDSYGKIQKCAYKALERFLATRTAKLISVSSGEAALLKEFLKEYSPKLSVVPNGVEVPKDLIIDYDRKPLEVIAVSRYDFQKNPEAMLEIAKELKRLRANIRITCIGTGPGRAHIESKLRKEGLEDSLILKGVSDMPRKVMRRSHVILSTSRWEGMPLALLEGMSEGLAVVASDVVGNRDVVIHEQDGYLYPIEDLSAAVHFLREIENDRSILKQFSKSAKQRVITNFSLYSMIEKTQKIYGSAMSEWHK